MAIKVRCKNCRKKISIDEAFAGGVCRCPYCGALNMAGGTAATGGPADRPDRPDAPGAAEAETPAEAHEHIPVARPVRIQGIVAIVLVALLLLMGGGAGVWAYYYRKTIRPGPEPENPFAEKGPRLADVEFAPPVVYVLDASSGTGDLFDSGLAVVRYSIRSLGEDDKFRLLLVEPDGAKHAVKDWTGGGETGDAAVKAFTAEKTAHGATDLAAAVREAIGLAPKTLVLVAGKAPAPDDDAVAALAAAAAGAGVVVHSVSLGDFPDATGPMNVLCEKTGGQCRAYSEELLDELLGGAPPLP